MTKSRAKTAFINAVHKLETIRIEPEELAGQLDAPGGAEKVRRYIEAFDRQTSRTIYAFFRYTSEPTKRGRA